MRLTALDECGVPLYDSALGSIITTGFISVSWEHETEEGTEYTSENAWGDFCIQEKDAPRVKWLNLGMDFCEIDPETMVMVAGSLANFDTDGMVGTFFDENRNVNAFAAEVWTRATGQPCNASGEPYWGYFAAAYVRNGMIAGGGTVENGTMNMEMSGNGFGAAPDPSDNAVSAWGTGPYADSPTVNPWPVGAFRYIGITDVQPPVSSNGARAIVVATGATEVTGAEGTLTPTNAGPPLTIAGLSTVIASPLTEWAVGSYITLGDGSLAHWGGSAWVAGAS
ncbi:hypothetical protein [Ilumatobacter sp.]|uniref:hypothetical protein n=1 Tax=Ilumatobacter sp. TaxID=1967498 RepID=UPI003752DFA7